MSEQTSPGPGDGWGFAPIGRENIPTHCGGYAYHEGAGHWVCAACDEPVHTRDIPGWTPRTDMAPAPATPRSGRRRERMNSMTFPSAEQLRAASLSLMMAPMVAGLTTALDQAVEVELYHSRAASLGVSRERADALLAEAQGLAAGSSPTADELAAALHLVTVEAMA